MKVSVISYAFNRMMRDGKVDIFGYLETVKFRFGLGYADIWNGMLTSVDPDYIAKVKAGLDERELKLADLACDGCHIWEDDADTRAAYAEKAWANIAAGEALGAKTIRIDAGGARPAMEFTNEQFDTIVAAYKKMCKRAEDGGYKLGPENHWGPDCVPSVMKKLCEAVDSPAFGVLMHIGRWKGDGAEGGDALIAPWAMHSHFGPQMSAEDTAGKMALLRDAGYKGCYGVEMVSDSYAEIAAQLARVKAILDRWRIEGKC